VLDEGDFHSLSLNMKTEAETLAETMDDMRKLTIHYFRRLDGFDIYHRFPAGNSGKLLNSACWIMGHLVVSQNYLMLQAIGGEKLSIPWAKTFGIGSSGELPLNEPNINEILTLQQAVHEKSLNYIRSLDEKALALPSVYGFAYSTEDSRRGLIRHAIRHEGVHAGQLAWLCELHGAP
jgi:hypothetical protein